MKLYLLLFLAVFMIGVASADVNIVNDVLFNLDNGAFIKVLATQNSTNITVYNSTNSPASSLQFYINGTPIRFTANTNKTLSNISYNNVLDILTYTGNGVDGYLNVSARMKTSLAFYDVKVDGNTSQVLISDNLGWVISNYTGWAQNQHNFEISQVPPPPPPGAPSITSWGNNKTNDQSTTLTINTSEFIRFNATANQSIDTWHWFKDDADQANNYDNFITNFTAGTHTIKVNATNNANGTSNTITWTVTVNAAPGIIGFAPSSPVNDIVGATRTFNITVNQTVDVTWYINGTPKQTDIDVTASSYTNTSATPGTWNVTAFANNANGTVSQQWTWNVTAAPIGAPNITGFTLSSPVSDIVGATRTFNITINQTVDVTWYINGTPKQTDIGVTASSYTNTSAAFGTWNVTAFANNANGAVSQQWTWNVTVAPTGALNIINFVPSSPVSNTEGSSRNFKITVNQAVNISWYINGTTVFNQTNVTESSYTNTSAAPGTWNVTAIANNANGTVSQQWTWTVTAALVPPPPATPSSVPGGGGAGVISPEPLHNIEQYEIMEEYLGANIPTSYILTTPSIVISEVLITPAKNFGVTSIRVEMLKDLSNIEGITPPSGIVYKYANIWVGAKQLEGEQGIEDAYIGFKVETGWLAENNLEDSSVKLLRWHGNKWVPLETMPKDRDDNFVYYESKTPGFSPFAIVAVPYTPSVVAQVTETPTIIAPFQKIVELIGEPGASRWVYIFIALVLGGLLVYSLINIKNAIKVNYNVADVLNNKRLIKIKNALKVSDKAEKIQHEDDTIWYNKGIALYESGKYEEAIKAYEKAIEINPENADAWYNKGFALYESGNYEEALKAYDKAREIIRTSRHRD